MVPEMTGGVFWEHLHRLVAGGLILLFGAAAWLAFRETPRFRWVRSWALAGVGLLLVQAILGGITVLLRLPDGVSTSHLGLAFLFLALVTVLSTVSSPAWEAGSGPEASSTPHLRLLAAAAVTLTLLQALVGAAVRHTDAGMACPDIPLCLGEWIPPLGHWMVGLHFAHRALGIFLLGLVLWVGHVAFWRSGTPGLRHLGILASLLALLQVLLGFLSVYFRLAVIPVSFHTLVAALLLVCLVRILTLTWAPSHPAREGEGAGVDASDLPQGQGAYRASGLFQDPGQGEG
jgi:cytochrome c oxidase assembly protein subunit 15